MSLKLLSKMPSLYFKLVMMWLPIWTMQVDQMCTWLYFVGLVLHTFVVECMTCFFGFGAESLTLLIMNFLMTQGAFKEKDLASRLVYFGVHGVSTFQGFRYGVIV